MNEIESFVRRLFKKSPHTKEDQETIKVLIEILEEKVDDLKEQGLKEEEAIHKTIIEFGEIDDFYHPQMEKEKKYYKRQKTIKHYKNDLLFACISSFLIIVGLAMVNLVYIDMYGPWVIIPAIGILFWPLSLLYKLLNKKGDD